MLTAIKGTFRDGRVELDEDPGIVGEASVIVTFLSSPTTSEMGRTNPELPEPKKMVTFGMLAVPGRRMSTEEDFKEAEYDDSTWDRGG